MKVLHIVSESYPIIGGHTIRNDNIFKELNKKIDRLDVVGSIFAFNKIIFSEGKSFNRNGMQYHQILTKKLYKRFEKIMSIPKLRGLLHIYYIFLNSFLIIKRINIETFDIIHGHSAYFNGLSSYLIARKYKKKFVYDLHALSYDSYPKKRIKYAISKRIEKFLIKNADSVIAIDEGLKDHVCNYFNINPESVFSAPNGIDGKLFSRNIKLNNQKIIPKNRFIIGIDNSKATENFEFILRNKERLIKQFPDVFFLIFANKDKNISLDTNYFKILPKLKYEEMPDYYSVLDLFIMPRIKNKQTDTVTPLKILEVMCCEVPILVSNAAGLTSCIKNNKTGFVFTADNFNDLVYNLQLIRNYANLQIIGKEARDWVIKNKSWENAANQYINAYNFIKQMYTIY